MLSTTELTNEDASTANTHKEADTLGIGDQVVDGNRPDRSTQRELLRIVTVSDRTADQHTLRSGEATVYSFNAPRGLVKRNERVLGCATEQALEQEGGDWWSHAPADILAKIVDDFEIRTFWFPQSRLERPPDPVSSNPEDAVVRQYQKHSGGLSS